MELREMADHLDLAPLLARWHVAEWGDLYEGWTVDVAEAEFLAMDRPGQVPTTWLAFADGDRSEPGDAVLGSVSLLADDDLDGFRHLQPWLASLYVVPEARGRGIGRQLVAHAVSQARLMGFARLHLFTAGQEGFYADLGWRVLARPVVRGHEAAVMVFDTEPTAPRRALVTRWCRDPDVAGTYSYLRPGGLPADRDRLARPVAPGLHLAGEATWSAHPGTMHGAWFSGERAARAVLGELPGGAERSGLAPRIARVVVVGAGLAGLAAARLLTQQGCTVIVLEAAPEPGGRIRADTSLGGPVHLGASWLHGEVGNPVAALADRFGVTYEPATWFERPTFLCGRGRLPAFEQRRLRDVYAGLSHELGDASRSVRPDVAVGPLARELVDRHARTDTERVVLGCWLRSEFEGLYAAPVDDLSLRHHAEPFHLPGHDQTVTASLGRLVDALVEGIDVRCGRRVDAVVARPRGGWRVDTPAGSLAADAVIVTVPVGALQAGRVRFEPPLPLLMVEALRRIGPGRVAKVFLTFDEPFWAPLRSFWVAGEPAHELPAGDAPLPAVSLWVDVSRLCGRPTLCGFATGAHAPVVEGYDEERLCALGDAILRGAGVLPPPGGPGKEIRPSDGGPSAEARP